MFGPNAARTTACCANQRLRGLTQHTHRFADDVLKGLTPIDVPIADDPLMMGFDVQYSQLIFERMLGLNVTYIASASFIEMYRSLRENACDVAITAVEMCVAAWRHPQSQR